jgi:hypothetical protein
MLLLLLLLLVLVLWQWLRLWMLGVKDGKEPRAHCALRPYRR